MATAQQKVILIIADISGYTKFMLETKTSLVHGQVAITQLMEAIIKEVDIPMEVSKLEGDAVFLYAVKNDDEARWHETKRHISEKLLTFFRVFYEALEELVATNFCHCQGCQNVDKLNLKILVHSGEALFYKIGRFEELSGVDVIVLHRLLKNSVTSRRYVLLSEAAAEDIHLDPALTPTRHVERYDDIGAINTLVFYPRVNGDSGAVDAGDNPHKIPGTASFFRKVVMGTRKTLRLLPRMLGVVEKPTFKNLPGEQGR